MRALLVVVAASLLVRVLLPVAGVGVGLFFAFWDPAR